MRLRNQGLLVSILPYLVFIITLTKAFAEPPAPSITSVSPGNGWVYVQWAPPSDGGLPILEYRLRIQPANGGPFQVFDLGSSTRARYLSGLINGMSYRVFIRARNEKGWGPFGAFPGSVTPLGPPGAPNLTQITPGDGQVLVQWTPPASDGGRPILGYRLRFQPANGGPFQIREVESSLRAQPLTGLSNGTSYRVFIRAKNEMGWGPFRGYPNPVTPMGLPAFSLTEAGELKIQVTGEGVQVTLHQDSGFYSVAGIGDERKLFEVAKVKTISVRGDLSENQVFKVGAASQDVVVHPLSIDSSIETTFVLGKINSSGEVAIGSRLIVIGSDITSVGPQHYQGKVEISGNRTLQAGSSPITFERDLDSSLFVFADPDSAPLGADLSSFFPDIHLTTVNFSGGVASVGAVKGSLQLSPHEVYAPTGIKVFGITNCSESCDAWEYRKSYDTRHEGKLLRLVFKKPLRSLFLDFSPRSLEPIAFSTPRIWVYSDASQSESFFAMEPENNLSISGKTKRTIGISQPVSPRPIFMAQAAWEPTSFRGWGLIDNFQGTLWEKPLQTVSVLTQGTSSFAGPISDRLNVITQEGSITPPRASHLFEGRWSGTLRFVNEGGGINHQRIELNLAQEVNDITGTLTGNSSALQGSLAGKIQGNDLMASLTFSSGPCAGAVLNLKITEFVELPPVFKLLDAGACSAYQPIISDLKRIGAD